MNWRSSSGKGGPFSRGDRPPAVVVLTDATTIAVDASLGNGFRVTIAGNRTVGNHSGGCLGRQ
jgi:hypothetical protein